MKRLPAALLILATGCAANPPPVQVIGTTSQVAMLAGEWNGEYRSVETGRFGSIWFKLAAGTDTAFGDVIMVPRENTSGIPDPRPAVEAMRTAPRVLTITFVRVEGGMVSGVIDPYRSPSCECMLSTVFRGTVRGDRIEGDFLIRHSEHDTEPQKGTWWVERVSKSGAP